MAFLAISLILIFTILFAVVKRIFRLSIFSPPMIMIVVWCFFIFAGLIFFYDYPWRYTSLIWIILACAAYTAGYISFIVYKGQGKLTKNRQTKINIKKTKRLLLGIIFLGLVYVALRLSTYGLSIASLLDITQLAEINNNIAVNRYSGGATVSLVLQLLLSFVYAAPLLGGFLFSYVHKVRERVLCLLSLLPVFIAFSATNEKATLIVSIFFIFSGFLVGYLNRYGRFPALHHKHIFIFTAIASTLLAILIASMMLRIGAFNIDTFYVVIEKLGNSYAFSHMPAFDNVFSAISHNALPSWGQYTFYGFADFLGLASREQGIYNDYFVFQDISTNVYTAFRGLILDFGIVGSLIVQLIAGFITAISIKKINDGAQSSIALGIGAVSYAFILYSFIVSLFSYMSLIIAVIIFTACCKYILIRGNHA